MYKMGLNLKTVSPFGILVENREKVRAYYSRAPTTIDVTCNNSIRLMCGFTDEALGVSMYEGVVVGHVMSIPKFSSLETLIQPYTSLNLKITDKTGSKDISVQVVNVTIGGVTITIPSIVGLLVYCNTGTTAIEVDTATATFNFSEFVTYLQFIFGTIYFGSTKGVDRHYVAIGCLSTPWWEYATDIRMTGGTEIASPDAYINPEGCWGMSQILTINGQNTSQYDYCIVISEEGIPSICVSQYPLNIKCHNNEVIIIPRASMTISPTGNPADEVKLLQESAPIDDSAFLARMKDDVSETPDGEKGQVEVIVEEIRDITAPYVLYHDDNLYNHNRYHGPLPRSGSDRVRIIKGKDELLIHGVVYPYIRSLVNTDIFDDIDFNVKSIGVKELKAFMEKRIVRTDGLHFLDIICQNLCGCSMNDRTNIQKMTHNLEKLSGLTSLDNVPEPDLVAFMNFVRGFPI